MTSPRLLSTAAVATVGLLSKAFLRLGTASVTVNGLQTLLHALESQERNNGRGIVTGNVASSRTTPADPIHSFKPHFDVRRFFHRVIYINNMLEIKPRRSGDMGRPSNAVLL